MASLKLALALGAILWAAPASADPVDRWASAIAAASARFGIPAAWISRVIRAESGGHAQRGGHPIVSGAGAMGLMQLMPATWRDMQLALGLGSDPHDPHDNILAGTAYLRLMYDRFGYPGLFAAYNAGPRRYAESLSGDRPLPPETRAYVAKLARTERHTGVTPDSVAAPPALFAVAPAVDGSPVTAAPFRRSGRLFVELGATAR